MFFVLNTIVNNQVASTVDLSVRIILTGLVIVIALVIGLLLRRILVSRLKKNTDLDAWLVQTLGVLVVIPPLILAAIATPVILAWSMANLKDLWYTVTTFLKLDQRTIISFSGNIVGTVLLIALGLGIARTARNLTVRGLETNRIDINMRTLIGRIFFIIILSVTAFWIFSIWSIPVGLPVATIGVITVALTVAVQDILKDLVAGFYILIEKPFFIGNLISTATYTGRVENVELRATKLRLVSGEEVTIPNSLVFGGIVVNNSYYGERRSSVNVTLPQEEFHKDETPERILAALHEIEHVLEKPEPTVIFSSYTEQKITLTIRFWIATEQPTTVTSVMYTLNTVFPQADLAVTEFAGNV
ncbi:MAG: mechanosensitive ion channel [Ktedonobacteraceae bacterium]|nr:mechanosensitive ion channel [Ktedonobacteraceae bacterium]